MTRARLLLLATSLALLVAAAPARANLTYFGGPVAHSMNVVLVKWGASVRSTYSDPTNGDPGFFSYLASQSGSASDIGGVLAQYMDSSTHNSANRLSYAGAVTISPAAGGTPPASVSDSQIQSQLASSIGSHTLSAPAGDGLSTIYVVLFPPGDDVCDSSGTCASDINGFCAYHGSFPLNGSTHVLYAAMVDNGPGTFNDKLCGPSASDIANQTDVTSHEFAETINDPLVAEADVNGPPLAWYDNANGEIGDICATGNGEQAPNGPWTVQKLWSNLDNACVASESLYAQPTASFSSTPASGSTLGFDGSASHDASSDHASASWRGSTFSIGSGIASYDWNWGDGSPHGSAASPVHSYASSGDYNVTLTVTDNIGFTSSVTQTIVAGTPGPSAVTGAADGISDQGATLHGSINPQDQTAQYRFAYGTSPGSLTSFTPTTDAPAGHLDTPVSATIANGLSPATTYYYRLELIVGSQTVPGQVQNFTTTSSKNQTQTPSAGTGGASAVGVSSATLNGTVNPGGPAPVSYRFVYGTSPSQLFSLTPSRSGGAGTTAAPVAETLGGLAPARRYYYRLEVLLGGHVYSGLVQSFVTLTPLPSVATRGAHVRGVSSTLGGTVDPHGFATRYHFELGRTRHYGKSSPAVSAGAGVGALSVSARVTGLRPHTLFHYRLVATSTGGTVVGADRTFRTGARLRHAPRFSFKLVRGQTLAGALVDGLLVRVRCARACVVSASAAAAPRRRPGAWGFPLTLARGGGALRGGVSGVVRLRFPRAVRARAARAGAVDLLVSGVVSAPGTDTSVPRFVRVRLGGR